MPAKHAKERMALRFSAARSLASCPPKQVTMWRQRLDDVQAGLMESLLSLRCVKRSDQSTDAPRNRSAGLLQLNFVRKRNNSR